MALVCYCTTTHAQATEEDLPCEDSNPQCQQLAQQGECESNQQEMFINCPVSCNACDYPWPTIADPDFDCGRPYASNGEPRSRRNTREANPDPAPGPQAETQGATTSGQQGPQHQLSVSDTFCGATPISDRFLLTSAYCALKKPIYSVRLGELDFSRENESNSRPVDYAIEQIIVHPDFDPSSKTRYNDLALLQTVEKIEFNDVVFPYCLPGVRPQPSTPVIGAGFGYVNATHQSPILQEADLLVMTPAECETRYNSEPLQWERLRQDYPALLQGSDLMCAGYPGRGPCKGDEGGPLYSDIEGHRYLVGIASFTGSCDNGDVMPGVYMSVADHIDFIDSVLYGI